MAGELWVYCMFSGMEWAGTGKDGKRRKERRVQRRQQWNWNFQLDLESVLAGNADKVNSGGRREKICTTHRAGFVTRAGWVAGNGENTVDPSASTYISMHVSRSRLVNVRRQAAYVPENFPLKMCTDVSASTTSKKSEGPSVDVAPVFRKFCWGGG